MEIHIKSLEAGSETLIIEVASVNTIDELKPFIRIKTGLSRDERLIFGGRELRGNNNYRTATTISDFWADNKMLSD